MAARIRRGYIDNIYGQLHYRITGEAATIGNPPLLCLHQSPKSGWDYEPLMPELGQDRVILAPDTPGYGGSDAPPAPVLIDDFARAMLRFVDDMTGQGFLPPGQFDVIGYHTGSATATALANRWPDRVRKVILVGLAAYDAETRKKKLEGANSFLKLREDASNVIDLWKIMESMHDPEIDLEWKHGSLAENLRAGPRLAWGFTSFYRYDLLKNLGMLRQPALVLAPEDDVWAITRATAPLLPNGRCIELPGRAHGFFKVDTASVCRIIRDFLHG